MLTTQLGYRYSDRFYEYYSVLNGILKANVGNILDPVIIQLDLLWDDVHAAAGLNE